MFVLAAAAAAAKSLQSCPTLCEPRDGSPPGSPVPGIFQARTLEWVAISFSNAWKWKVKVKSLSHVRLFATPWTAASLPGSSIHGIFQARVLEWGATAFSDACASSCPNLCDPMDCSPPGSSVHGILQQEYWSGLPCPPSGKHLLGMRICSRCGWYISDLTEFVVLWWIQ